MKAWSKPKRIIFILLLLVCVLRIGYIFIGAEVDKKYITSASLDVASAEEIPCINLSQIFQSDQKHLNSLELIFTGIQEEQSGAVVLKISKDGELVYQTNLSLAKLKNNEWIRVFTNMPLDPGQNYVIELDADENCIQPPNLLLSYGAPEAIRSKANSVELDRHLAIQYGYLLQPAFLDKVSIASLWVWFLFGCAFLLHHADMLLLKCKKTFDVWGTHISKEILIVIIEFIFCAIILNCSRIMFQEPTKIIFYIVSLVSAVKFSEKTEAVMLDIDRAWKRVLLVLMYIYSAIALVGQRLLISFLTPRVTMAGGFVFLIAVLWFVPVVNSVIYGLNLLGRKLFSEENVLKTVRLVPVMLVLLLLPACYHLFANNPGISSQDTVSIMAENVRQIYGMSDWHPAFYSMVIGGILKIWDSTYAVIFVQYFFWSYVMLEMLLYLIKKGMKIGGVLGIALFSGLNAANFVHINTIWKDIPYTLSILWVLIILAKLVLHQKEYKGKYYIYFELVIALAGTYLYRKNGVVSFVIIVFMALVILRKNRRLMGAVALSIAVIFIVKGPIYTHFQIQETGRTGIYIGLGQDILGVYYTKGEVSEETLKMINVMTKYNNSEYVYVPTYAQQSYDLDVSPKEFILCYVKTFVRNPILMVRAIINREDIVWDIFCGETANVTCVNYYGTMDHKEEWRRYYPERVYYSLYTSLNAEVTYTADSQWISAIIWRCGLFMLLALISLLTLVIKKGIGDYLLIFAPVIGHIMSLLLTTGWSDFRYFWPLNLMNMCVILFAVVLLHEKIQDQ